MKFQSQLKSAEQGRQLELTAKLDAAGADESVAGLEFKKVVKLGKGKRCLEIVATLANPTKDVMGAALGVRNRSLQNN